MQSEPSQSVLAHEVLIKDKLLQYACAGLDANDKENSDVT